MPVSCSVVQVYKKSKWELDTSEVKLGKLSPGIKITVILNGCDQIGFDLAKLLLLLLMMLMMVIMFCSNCSSSCL